LRTSRGLRSVLANIAGFALRPCGHRGVCAPSLRTSRGLRSVLADIAGFALRPCGHRGVCAPSLRTSRGLRSVLANIAGFALRPCGHRGACALPSRASRIAAARGFLAAPGHGCRRAVQGYGLRSVLADIAVRCNSRAPYGARSWQQGRGGVPAPSLSTGGLPAPSLSTGGAFFTLSFLGSRHRIQSVQHRFLWDVQSLGEDGWVMLGQLVDRR
jgi:hypothetical protein